MKNRKINYGDNLILVIFSLIIIFILATIKEIWQIIVWIFKKAFSGISKLIHNKKGEKLTMNDTKKFIEEIKNNENTEIEEIKYVTPYDALFKNNIIKRGTQYFKDKKVTNYKYANDECSAKIVGENIYNTRIVFDDNKENIKDVECSCPFFTRENKYCKHIYALLLTWCKKENINGFAEYKNVKNKFEEKKATEGKTMFNQMLELINEMDDIITDIDDIYIDLNDTSMIDDEYFEMSVYEQILNDYKELKLKEINQNIINAAKITLKKMEHLSELIKLKIEDFLVDDDFKFNMPIDYQDEFDRNELKMRYGLSDYEIDEVEKGNYEPWNFEEEDLEDDDYYYEDDE